MKKTYKVRVFYNAWQDVYIEANDEDEVSDIVDELDTNDVKLELDFYETLDNV